MKKATFIVILAVTAVVAFVLGMAIDKSTNRSNKKDSVVGVYKTDNWNGKTGTLVLYEDGTCQYPSGGSYKWELDKNVIRIIAEHSITIPDDGVESLQVFVNDDLSDAEIRSLAATIERFDNVASVMLCGKTDGNGRSESFFTIMLNKMEKGKQTYDAISQISGVREVIEIIHEQEGIDFPSEYEAKVMERGLVLHGHFFEKVSD